jgi:hypothetical protein
MRLDSVADGLFLSHAEFTRKSLSLGISLFRSEANIIRFEFRIAD